ncbi:unnamed protein product [Fusarium graminearum]|nr:unnamed protein product [Fusarium graminearum]
MENDLPSNELSSKIFLWSSEADLHVLADAKLNCLVCNKYKVEAGPYHVLLTLGLLCFLQAELSYAGDIKTNKRPHHYEEESPIAYHPRGLRLLCDSQEQGGSVASRLEEAYSSARLIRDRRSVLSRTRLLVPGGGFGDFYTKSIISISEAAILV